MSFRIGYGWDSHEFKRGIPLKIGGVRLSHDKGLAGHSDGDVLLHALADALLGAVSAGDIGQHFPPSDKRWKGADSAVFVREALKRVVRAGFNVANVDSTVILAAPRIGPHSRKIRSTIAELLKIDSAAVSVKAKTPEGMGTENAAIAHVVVLLTKRAQAGRAVLEAEEAVPQPVIDDVVERVLEGISEPAKKKSGSLKSSVNK
ncbi:MAG TPA: 2-C-methyl-D-erythritol 2,4-cyclodiphosphate synthase [Terriglobales bacterium]|jgi:2-C-methyl-D-erythritol 2,4-cyclodiphosphate synthase|nr:2-C-methyl-D-erythritol 2,4-cyclodiphosphate synthase [Terriglobales bacterium]